MSIYIYYSRRWCKYRTLYTISICTILLNPYRNIFRHTEGVSLGNKRSLKLIHPPGVQFVLFCQTFKPYVSLISSSWSEHVAAWLVIWSSIGLRLIVFTLCLRLIHRLLLPSLSLLYSPLSRQLKRKRKRKKKRKIVGVFEVFPFGVSSRRLHPCYLFFRYVRFLCPRGFPLPPCHLFPVSAFDKYYF